MGGLPHVIRIPRQTAREAKRSSHAIPGESFPDLARRRADGHSAVPTAGFPAGGEYTEPGWRAGLDERPRGAAREQRRARTLRRIDRRT